VSNIEELKVLKELLDDGTITQEEFEAQKKKMLSGSPDIEEDALAQKKAKRKRGCLIAVGGVVAVVLLLIIIGALSSPSSTLDDSGASQGNITLENEASDENETSDGNTAEEWRKFDERTWEDFKSLSTAHKDLVNAAGRYSEGEITIYGLHDEWEKAKEYFQNASASFEYGKNDEEREYLSMFKSIALYDQTAAEASLQALDAATSGQGVGGLSTIIAENAGKAKDEILEVTSKRAELLKKTDYTELEMDEKLVETMELLALLREDMQDAD
jgi:major membrane immunogen (membrane-anchored lipoprotein)